MAHGKETPRQKMIGMMYLVLTALLALNVQKEVLNAFVIVDEGISKMNENYAIKNNRIYDDFNQAVAEKPKKATKWRDIAFKVKAMADALDEMIYQNKIEIINIVEGPKTPSLEGKKIHPMLFNGKENTDKPAEVMIVKGGGKRLKEAIKTFREFLLAQIEPKAEGVRNAILTGLNTDDPPAKGGKTETWESEHFEHLPMVGVITIMSGLQSNVRNAESDILRYLYSMIDKGTFKFTNLEATVIHNSNYIIQGNEYQASVFLAAYDTVQKPTIYIGPYDSARSEDGSMTYSKRPNFKYDSLVINYGKGYYVRKGTTVGYNKYTGLIMLKAPEGGADLCKPFKGEYQVAAPMLVVSPTKLNLFYVGVDNPVEISVPGVPADKLFPTISNGTIRKEGVGFIVNPARPGQPAEIKVIAEIEKGKKINMGTKTFRVRIVPDPVAKVNGIKGAGSIERSVFLAQVGVIAEMENFEFDLSFKVTEFTVSTIVGGFAVDKSVKSNRFTPEQMNLIKNQNKGQKVYIENIKAIGPDGTTRMLGSIALTLK
jgi:gliding motility-associated protein GldM